MPITATKLHEKARCFFYPGTKIKRFPVPDKFVPWISHFHEYKPVEYTNPHLLGKDYSDPKIGSIDFQPKFNHLNGNVDRVSYEGIYEVVNGYPLNPAGRTGIVGRGNLGRWGPNHAADPVVTRWKWNNKSCLLHPVTQKPILEFVAILRRDCNEWALPGGMVDPGETVSSTLKREFMEETLNSKGMTRKSLAEVQTVVSKFFANGVEIFRGYVDDPRNTDNAWVETIACHFHDLQNEFLQNLHFAAGDDAKKVQWMDVDSNLNLYASHIEILKKLQDLMGCHF